MEARVNLKPLSTPINNELKASEKKIDQQRIRGKDKADRATVEQVFVVGGGGGGGGGGGDGVDFCELFLFFCLIFFIFFISFLYQRIFSLITHHPSSSCPQKGP